jgi:hypothetical protein
MSWPGSTSSTDMRHRAAGRLTRQTSKHGQQSPGRSFRREHPRRWSKGIGLPLLKLLNAQFVDPEDPSAGMTIYVDERLCRCFTSCWGDGDVLKGDRLSGLLPSLGSNEDAATHDFSASYMRPGHTGETLVCNARVLHRSGRLAFVFAELMHDDQLIATATVTKSIVRVTTD